MINSKLPFLPFDLAKLVEEMLFKLRPEPVMRNNSTELAGRFEPNDCANRVNIFITNHKAKINIKNKSLLYIIYTMYI